MTLAPSRSRPVSLVTTRTYRDAQGRRVVELDGVDRIPAWDRPPKRIVDYLANQKRVRQDTSPTRPPIAQKGAGRGIAELAGRHSGACAILHNGESLPALSLGEIRVPLIGMNRTYPGFPGYSGPVPTYYCYFDAVWATKPEVRALPQVINGCTDERDPSSGKFWRATRSHRMGPISLDLARDGFVGPTPCVTGFLALQLALYLGFSRIYLLGLDLRGGHFDGTNASSQMVLARDHYQRMADALGPRAQSIFVCGSPQSLVQCFPQAPLEQLLREQPGE